MAQQRIAIEPLARRHHFGHVRHTSGAGVQHSCWFAPDTVCYIRGVEPVEGTLSWVGHNAGCWTKTPQH
ncbi:unnamed protein product [Arctia plantaginis]|uniref:Uncharacterized protein n=1 Tax=Arctia plantaginis TaxID=874455 RepID=A0A8S0ZF10_ARCPL|nr:unnamed protein product [Arctia plantaginis]